MLFASHFSLDDRELNCSVCVCPWLEANLKLFTIVTLILNMQWCCERVLVILKLMKRAQMTQSILKQTSNKFIWYAWILISSHYFEFHFINLQCVWSYQRSYIKWTNTQHMHASAFSHYFAFSLFLSLSFLSVAPCTVYVHTICYCEFVASHCSKLSVHLLLFRYFAILSILCRKQCTKHNNNSEQERQACGWGTALRNITMDC